MTSVWDDAPPPWEDPAWADAGIPEETGRDTPPDAEPAETPFHRSLVTRSGLGHLPPVDPLIEGVMSLRAAAVLVGATGAGKSFLALAWACCVGTGTAWLGHAVTQKKVLYVVGEGASGLNARITAWERAWHRTGVADDQVVFAVKPPDLATNGGWQQLTREAQDLGAGFVVLDTFSSLYPTADETKDAARITRELSDLTSAIDGTALLVHHPGWGDPERTRGGYQLTANVDEVLLLRGTAKDPNLALERTKAKDDAAGSPIHLLRKAVYESCIIEGRTADQVMEAAGHSVADMVRDTFGDAPFSRTALRDAVMEGLGLTSPTSAYKHITALLNSHTIERAGGTDGRPVFRLSDDPGPTEPDTADEDPFAPREPF